MSTKKLSAAGRKAISEAQKARWAKIHQANGGTATKTRKTRQTKVALKGGKFLQTAIEEASKSINAMVKAELQKEVKNLPRASFIWTTRGGQQIAPSEMTEEHLRNTISFLLRKLVHGIGTTTWVADVHPMVQALDAMLSEAQRRDIRV